MNSLAVFITFFLLASLSHATIENDYCVADFSLPRGPEGYPCKNPATLTVDDFVYRGFRTQLTTTNIFHVNATIATVDQFPALNGLGLSMAQIDFGVDGVVPVHTHRTSEMIVVIKGSIMAGIIDTYNVAYYKRLEVGDVMIFPKFLLHFQINVGKTPARAIVALNGAKPGVQIMSTALFGGNMPPEIASKITAIDLEEATRMNKVFHGLSGSSRVSYTA